MYIFRSFSLLSSLLFVGLSLQSADAETFPVRYFSSGALFEPRTVENDGYLYGIREIPGETSVYHIAREKQGAVEDLTPSAGSVVSRPAYVAVFEANAGGSVLFSVATSFNAPSQVWLVQNGGMHPLPELGEPELGISDLSENHTFYVTRRESRPYPEAAIVTQTVYQWNGSSLQSLGLLPAGHVATAISPGGTIAGTVESGADQGKLFLWQSGVVTYPAGFTNIGMVRGIEDNGLALTQNRRLNLTTGTSEPIALPQDAPPVESWGEAVTDAVTLNIHGAAVSQVAGYENHGGYPYYLHDGFQSTIENLVDSHLPNNAIGGTWYAEGLSDLGQVLVLNYSSRGTVRAAVVELGFGGVPAPVTASASRTQGGVSVTWQPVPNAAFFEIFKSTTRGGAPTRIGRVNAPETRFLDAAASGSPCYYSVTAVNVYGRSAAGTVAEVSAPGTAQPTPTATPAGSNPASPNPTPTATPVAQMTPSGPGAGTLSVPKPVIEKRGSTTRILMNGAKGLDHTVTIYSGDQTVWSAAWKNRKLKVTRLPAGTYRLVVTARSLAGDKSGSSNPVLLKVKKNMNIFVEPLPAKGKVAKKTKTRGRR